MEQHYKVLEDDGNNAIAMDHAKIAAGILSHVYPGYEWLITVHPGGGFSVKVKDSLMFGQYGFFVNDNFPSISRFKKDIIMAGGEILERMNAGRGTRPEDWEPDHLEGAEKRFNRNAKSQSNIILGQ